MSTDTVSFTCPAGHPRVAKFREREGCAACREIEATAELVDLLTAAAAELDAESITDVLAAASGSAKSRNELRAWLRSGPHVLRSGSSDCPVAGARLIAELARRGVDAVAPRCLDCGKARPLPKQVDGGRICQTCNVRRNAEACATCGVVKPVAYRRPDGAAVCLRCRTLDPSTWQPCGRCGNVAQVVAIDGDLKIGRCCYVAPGLRCTVCGIRQGERPWKTRRPVCTECQSVARVPCSTCGLDAAARRDESAARCARCATHPAQPCSVCGTATPSKDVDGNPRCADCYQRPDGTCGRCGRVRPIVRLAREGDPDLCAVCWRGPVGVCEGCGRVGPRRGERQGRMLCIYCRPVTSQVCAHCGEARPPTAHWHEGPVCRACYNRALAAKADCPSCGEHRRLRHYPGFDVQVCADCAGQPATHVCSDCGIEDLLYERGRCPRCTLRGRLTELLGDESARAHSGLAPLFDALAAADDPRAAIDWLLKSRTIPTLARIAAGEVRLTHETIDSLTTELSVGTIRHLERLLTATGALAERDIVLAATERWCDRRIATVSDDDHIKLLRTWVRWQILRPMHERAESGPVTEAVGNGARTRLKAATEFCDYLTERRRTLSICRQGDLDEWAASRTRSATHALAGFARWAMARGAMPRLAIPTGQNHPPNAPLPDEERWALARHLLHGEDVDCGLRLAGALVVIYAQPLNKISRLRTVDLDVSTDRVTVCLGRATIELPEPLASHARQLIDERQPHPRKARLPVDAGWLFPGAPGRPINPDSLSDRLARLGIRAAQHRLAALLHLAADVPALLLADLLGIHPNTAQVWSRLANRGWGDYQGMRTEAVR